MATVEGGEEQEIPRNQGKLQCFMYVSTLNKIWSQEPTAQTEDICPDNNGAFVSIVVDHSRFINGICFHSSVCEAVTHWAPAISVEKPGIKLTLWGIF